MAWTRQWHKHPAVRAGQQLSLGERAADHMRNGMGSWTFVFVFLVFMAAWAFVNTVLRLGGHNKGLDPSPYILINLMLSTMARLRADPRRPGPHAASARSDTAGPRQGSLAAAHNAMRSVGAMTELSPG
jgi:Protein of unknown function (DUF1003)